MLKSSFLSIILSTLFLLFTTTSFSQRKAAQSKNCPSCDLSGKDFSGQNLTDVNFNNANLDGANFENANLSGAMLSGVSAVGANFKNAKLNNSYKGPTNLDNANLTNANFNGAQMNGTQLEYAIITSADFSNTDLTKAIFGPVLYYDKEANNTNKVKFRNCKLNCEFPWYWEFFDLEGTKKPSCDNFKREQKSTTINTSKDSIVVSTEAVLKVGVDSVLFNRVISSSFASIIYVSSTQGIDGPGCGGLTNPCATIGRGIDECTGTDCAVYVDYGQYYPTSSINLKNGVSLIGGTVQGQPTVYQSDVFAPGDGSPAFIGNGLTAPAVFQNFIVNGRKATSASKASIAIQLVNSSNLTMSFVNINASAGAHGNNGAASTSGAKGGNGGNGNSSTGGGGGASSCSNSNGGKGGDKEGISNTKCECCAFLCVEKCIGFTVTEYPGWSGSPGSTGVYASGGSPGNNTLYGWPSSNHPNTPAAGKSGNNATSCGTGGTVSNDVAGTFSNNAWLAGKGGDGVNGGSGGGGGGGGSGGSCGYLNFVGSCSFYNGAPGGGGGGGGCGATAGGGGFNGGASFGLVLISSSFSASGNVFITPNAGGKGGDGHNGASGGAGGSAGSARSVSSKCNDGVGGQGGAGGAGGAGAASGGGAGGNGGPSISIALVGTSTINGAPIYYTGASGIIGLKGAGGSPVSSGLCTGGSGSDGKPGTVANTHQY